MTIQSCIHAYNIHTILHRNSADHSPAASDEVEPDQATTTNDDEDEDIGVEDAFAADHSLAPSLPQHLEKKFGHRRASTVAQNIAKFEVGSMK